MTNLDRSAMYARRGFYCSVIHFPDGSSLFDSAARSASAQLNPVRAVMISPLSSLRNRMFFF